MSKPSMAIFDLTDCEGCELQIINLKEKFLEILEYVEITNWRLVEEMHESGSYDVAVIEGSAQTDDDIEILKNARNQATYVIALGACACIGGIPSLAGGEKERREFFDLIYGPEYKPKAKESKPIDAYIDVDFYINGCPV